MVCACHACCCMGVQYTCAAGALHRVDTWSLASRRPWSCLCCGGVVDSDTAMCRPPRVRWPVYARYAAQEGQIGAVGQIAAVLRTCVLDAANPATCCRVPVCAAVGLSPLCCGQWVNPGGVWVCSRVGTAVWSVHACCRATQARMHMCLLMFAACSPADWHVLWVCPRLDKHSYAGTPCEVGGLSWVAC